jgi:gamma-glutamyltranspeptidase/glutathione hydrolase
MGHRLRPVSNLGVLMGITYNPILNVYIGASDSSSEDGAAVGY